MWLSPHTIFSYFFHTSFLISFSQAKILLFPPTFLSNKQASKLEGSFRHTSAADSPLHLPLHRQEYQLAGSPVAELLCSSGLSACQSAVVLRPCSDELPHGALLTGVSPCPVETPAQCFPFPFLPFPCPFLSLADLCVLLPHTKGSDPSCAAGGGRPCAPSREILASFCLCLLVLFPFASACEAASDTRGGGTDRSAFSPVWWVLVSAPLDAFPSGHYQSLLRRLRAGRA